MIDRIASFGIGGTMPRVYWFGQGVMETGVEAGNQWFTSNLLYDQLNNPAFNSSIACFGVQGQFSRVYYSGDNHTLIEFAFIPQITNWVANNLTQNQNAPLVTPGSGIACYGVNNEASRVYYFNNDGKVVEMAYLNQNVPWQNNNLNDLTGAPLTGATRVITCFGVGGGAARAYYFDQHGSVIELAWGDDQRWHSSNISAAANAPPASLISSITCFGVNGQTTRVYYFDAQQNVIELGYGDNNQWYAANISAPAGAPPAHAPSGLTCFGVEGRNSRIYYFDAGMNLIELGWGADNRWYSANLTTACNAPQANGSLTCFGDGGQATRVYYLAGSPSKLWEVSFANGSWHAMAVSP